MSEVWGGGIPTSDSDLLQLDSVEYHWTFKIGLPPHLFLPFYGSFTPLLLITASPFITVHRRRYLFFTRSPPPLLVQSAAQLLIRLFNSLKYFRNLIEWFFLGCIKHGAPHSESLHQRRTPNVYSCSIYSLNIFLHDLGAGKGFTWYGVAYYSRTMSTGSIFQTARVPLNSNSYLFNSKYNFLRSSLSILVHASDTFKGQPYGNFQLWHVLRGHSSTWPF